MFYGYLGVGLTSFTDKFYVDLAEQGDFNVNFTDNEHTYGVTNFNFQVTPAGIRFGDSFAGYAEVGFGYKGC